MNRHPFAAGHKTNDLLAGQRLTTLGQIDQEVGISGDLEGVAPNRRRRGNPRPDIGDRVVPGGRLLPQRAGHHRYRRFPETDCRQQILFLGQAAALQHDRQLLAAADLFE